MAARDIAIFSNTLDISGNLLLINCETRREQKGKVFVVMEVRVVLVILVTGIQGRRQEKKVVYMMDVMLEVVVATFLRPCYQNTDLNISLVIVIIGYNETLTGHPFYPMAEAKKPFYIFQQ
ncbi:hypothetical protein NC653_033665 [Populus alba x Populus x berolinensis]|uniref:Uncharacterized protein n=1 Tax=Populus alba x Populus x berolinensis TaxID=444605 RepID=A0AAD6LUE7_9ROSI|nr:hypothetical protein NC653_033665 [Populus alba x Populus x berolinensis]